MINFFIKMFFINGFLLLFSSAKAYAAVVSVDLQPKFAVPQLGQSQLQKKRHITINQQKFELVSQQDDHWLLFDPQVGQYCITRNELVVVTSNLKLLLRQVGWIYDVEDWHTLAENTYRWTGPLELLLQLQRKLKKVADVRVEWQLQYLPLSNSAEM